jgi:hypothetical protein
VEIERVLVLRIEGALTGVDVIALLEEASGAAMRGNRATAAVQAARACRQVGVVVPEVEDPAVAGLVVVAGALVEAAVAAGGS